MNLTGVSREERRREMRDRVLKDATAMRRFVADWDANENRETQTYFYRSLQLTPITARGTWYNQRISSVREWCDQRDKDIKALDHLLNQTDSPTTSLGDDLANDHLLGLLSQMCVSGITQRLSYFHSTLSEPAARFPDVLQRLTKECESILSDVRLAATRDGFPPKEDHRLHARGQDFLHNLLLFLLNQLYVRGFNETGIIHAFLLQLKEFYKCDVVDYLDATDDGQQLLWRVGTVTRDDLSKKYRKTLAIDEDALRTAIQQDESYGRGVGITGSALLIDTTQFSIWRHIGSNDVPNDPRESIVHRSAYEQDMYPRLLTGKQIRNFWAFPLLSSSKLKGVFRVVNLTTTSRYGATRALEKGGWPYLMRVELAVIAFWFSQFLEAARPLLDRRLDFIELMDRDARISELLRKMGAQQWIQNDTFKHFLEHMRKDINKREESRRVGCCIGLVYSEGSSVLNELPEFPVIDVSQASVPPPFDALDDYHDAVSPALGAYLFRHDGQFVRVASLNVVDSTGHSERGPAAIKKVTAGNEKAVFLHLERGHRSIHVYSAGQLMAEIYISEREGAWRFRYPQELLEAMTRERRRIDKDVITVVWEASLELMAQGHGALFVIGDISTDPYELRPARFAYKTNQKVTSLRQEYLAEFAKIDGATFIDDKGYLRRVATIVQPKKHSPSYTLFIGRGGRHQTAEMISRNSPSAMIVVISENRGLNVLRNGVILWSTDRAVESPANRRPSH